MLTMKDTALGNQASTNTTGPFELHRPLLLGLAYRLLGSMCDAQDVVQEAYVRWTRTDRDAIREPRAFLITVVSRLALDQLKSARASRETYAGPWLPETVATARLGPLDTTELRDTVSYATLHLMGRVVPPERAVFVLREAFELPYTDIADILGNSAQSCRQCTPVPVDASATAQTGSIRPGRTTPGCSTASCALPTATTCERAARGPQRRRHRLDRWRRKGPRRPASGHRPRVRPHVHRRTDLAVPLR